MMIELSGLKKESLEKTNESSERIIIPKEMRETPKPGSIPPWENVTSNAVRDNVTRTELTKGDKADIVEQADEIKEKKGGSYAEVKETSDGAKSEVHHMPADSATDLDRDDGPAIKMDKEDHRQTASCGNSKEAQEYRAKQKELIEQGKFREALQMDIDDIHEKFGDKYNDAIEEMKEYVEKLEEEDRV
jgi:hypothetical protein